jgi:hypothetical protein
MSFKPDYGLRLLREGYSANVLQSFTNFCLFSLTVLSRGQYSTMVEIPWAGEMHALSLDFNHQQLDEILKKAKGPREVVDFIQQEIKRDPVTPRTIDFPGTIIFAVNARLGEVQRSNREEFVPLVVEEIK